MADPIYRYQDQEGIHTITRSKILRDTFEWWSEQMRKRGKDDQISEDACVEDFCVNYWAWKVHDG